MKKAMTAVQADFPATSAGQAFEAKVHERYQAGNAFALSMKNELTASMSARNTQGFGAKGGKR